MEIDHLTSQENATVFLADCLKEGTLVLFLGAGVSSGANLPRWRTLVERMRDEVKLPNGGLNDSADSLQQAAEEVRLTFRRDEDAAFAKLVHTCLYRGVQLENLFPDKLLISLGALMMGSRRGSAKRVVSFNFDSILEWYLSLCGFVPSVIIKPPVEEGAEDVRVYHPHWFLPHPGLQLDGSDFVILDRRSVDLRIGQPGNPWQELLRHVFSTGTALFIGLSVSSFRDRAIGPLLSVTGTVLEDTRPTGFWILPEDEVYDASVDQEMLARNVVPLHLKKEEISKFLLGICQHASGPIRVAGGKRL